MSDDNKAKARIGVVLPDEHRRWLKLRAAQLDVSMSTLTSKIISDYIEVVQKAESNGERS